MPEVNQPKFITHVNQSNIKWIHIVNIFFQVIFWSINKNNILFLILY